MKQYQPFSKADLPQSQAWGLRCPLPLGPDQLSASLHQRLGQVTPDPDPAMRSCPRGRSQHLPEATDPSLSKLLPERGHFPLPLTFFKK